ncbi:tRNA (N6-threonylcarbamoyladenosine(37)-N6)-methyltransferase TrmO [Thermomicrobium sp. CFH 73360]|uniref:tRNA (N6-threonylcarbamoyladenosine(37)-N6)-methyltransferase TrmO n=1 Tax=Thermomicrobium sp. CFH 73360 TaxID=2951987 RepID=UPI002076B240|nr:tRNA (N6-threonylcarbamoyladenosine(37)-N6)-methyltransferase TrmO [Thermomicrobium sp. CFH 73360]
MSLETFEVVPIGVVHSPVADRRLMPPGGVQAEIEVYPEFADGLLRIEENSHIWVLGWFVDADRERLQLVRPEYEPPRRRRGVFGLRSVARPNPIALTATRLLAVEGTRLRVAPLDFIDGTLVVDLKRYSPSWDCIFSARSSRDRYLIDLASAERLAEYELEAMNFHGELCPWVVTGARLIQYVSVSWQVRPKDAELAVTVSVRPELCHLADVLQALTGATFASGRLLVSGEEAIAFHWRERTLVVVPRALPSTEFTKLRTLPLEDLFELLQ